LTRSPTNQRRSRGGIERERIEEARERLVAALQVADA
jgi:hypothetical protein